MAFLVNSPRVSRLRAIAILLFLVAAVLAALFLPVGDLVAGVAAWVRAAGPGGAAVLFASYVAAILLFVPASPMGLATGFVYGPFWGLALASPAIVVGSSAAFGLGYAFARPLAARLIARNQRIAAIDRAVAREGFTTILLLRFAPVVPFNLLNYVLGTTRLRFRDFAVATWLGTLPSAAIYAYLGSQLRDLDELRRGGLRGTGVWIAIAVSIVMVALATRVVRRRLRAPSDPHL